MQNQPVQRAAAASAIHVALLPAGTLCRWFTQCCRMAETSLWVRPASKGDVDVRLSKLDAAAFPQRSSHQCAGSWQSRPVPPAGNGHVVGREYAGVAAQLNTVVLTADM